MKKKYFLHSLIFSGFCALCIAEGTVNSNVVCAANSPLFTEKIGTNLINHWGNSVFYFSPNGAAGYTDPYVGAAYFTGTEYISDAVLLPTVSPVTRLGSQKIYNYFTNFLSHGPRAINNPGIPESGGPFMTLAGCGYGIISSYYNIKYQDGSLETNARYTFQFEYLSSPEVISIIIEGGSQRGSTILINQAPGWHIKLQNSAKLPSVDGLPSELLIK